MNIEERSIPEAIRAGGRNIGHIHFVDSNRRAAGQGHIDLAGAVAALGDIDYNGYLSAEAIPYPDSDTAAAQTITAFKRVMPASH
jgi:sugar phosphate isomerase/epimerase